MLSSIGCTSFLKCSKTISIFQVFQPASWPPCRRQTGARVAWGLNVVPICTWKRPSLFQCGYNKDLMAHALFLPEEFLRFCPWRRGEIFPSQRVPSATCGLPAAATCNPLSLPSTTQVDRLPPFPLPHTVASPLPCKDYFRLSPGWNGHARACTHSIHHFCTHLPAWHPSIACVECSCRGVNP